MAKFDMDTYIQKMAMDVAETQDEFIFQTIGPFVNDIAGFSVSKQELAEAVSLLRMKKLANDKYGVLISNDIYTATQQSYELSRAYERGVMDGIEKERRRIRDLVDSEERED